MNPIVKSSLRFSIIATLFNILMFFILIALDRNPVVYGTNLIFMGPFIAIFLFLSVKSFKDGNPEGLRFWQGFSVGILFTVFFVLLNGLYLIGYSEFTEGVFFDEYRSLILERLVAGKEMLVDQLGEEGYQEYKKSAKSTNFQIIRSLATNNLIIGILVTPIISLFMRTSEPKRQ